MTDSEKSQFKALEWEVAALKISLTTLLAHLDKGIVDNWKKDLGVIETKYATEHNGQDTFDRHVAPLLRKIWQSVP